MYFEETVRINEDGRCEVSLPCKGDRLSLPNEKEIAIKRLETSTRKLHHENLFTVYDDVFKEWASLGYDRMLRMAVRMKRFIFNCRNSTSRITGELSHQEMKQAELNIVKIIQDEYFIHEVNRKKLNSLATYKDEEGILRVKTKITYQKDSEDFKNPIILPSYTKASRY
ncbi:hypothetical protein AVEN_134655-1 [Araneus ventricosus]|uniref:Uncharacterized protein n=1 Tax=Araneus ventricosus TaxID=182803 RepID=A0A4Y2F6C1_ARAVE|nr:hypothetical protein AVEN_134655-1 [Araneus ventricosus]